MDGLGGAHEIPPDDGMIAVAVSELTEPNVIFGRTRGVVGHDSISFGDGAYAEGDRSVAIGSNAHATEADSVVIGNDSTKVVIMGIDVRKMKADVDKMAAVVARFEELIDDKLLSHLQAIRAAIDVLRE